MNTLTVRLFALAAAALLLPAPGVRGQTTPTLVTLYNFTGGADGADPLGTLVDGGDGRFYGTCLTGGSNDEGAVFAVTPAGGLVALHDFGVAPDGTKVNEGQNPFIGLTPGPDGNFYGVALNGGANDLGTVFTITPDGVLTVLHSFGTLDADGHNADGANPQGGLALGSDGNFYGTTRHGGANGVGTVFAMTPAGVLTPLHSFDALDTNDHNVEGSIVRGGLTPGPDGNFYGTTQAGGGVGAGTVFAVSPAGVVRVLHTFGSTDGDGEISNAALTPGTDGRFYGVTARGGANGTGTVFAVTPDGVLTILHSFAAVDDNNRNTDGSAPNAALTSAPDGNFYGVTSQGGASGTGTVFAVTPAGSLTVLYTFGFLDTNNHNADGANPYGGLVLGQDDNFYGTTTSGGGAGRGTIFRLPFVSPGEVGFAAGSAGAATAENAGSVTLVVQRRDGRTNAVSVDYATVDGSAVAGVDYTATGGTLTWTDGDATDKTITVPILDAGVTDGGTRTFTVALGNPAGGAVLGATATATVSIVDGDAPPTPAITSALGATATVGAAFSYQITATNAPTSFGADGLPDGLSVDAATGLITGTPAAAGSFVVTLSAANAGGRGTAGLALTINPAPAPPPTVSIAVGGDGLVVEDGEAGKVFVTRTGGDTSQPLTVAYKVKGPAVAGTDYKALPGTVTIPAGAAKAKVKVKALAGSPNAGVLKLKFVLLPPIDGSYTVGTSLAKLKLIGQ